MIKYYKNYIDDNSFVHSIDMVKVVYDGCAGIVEDILASFRQIKEKGIVSDKDYWEKVNCTPCAKWNYWLHHIHIGNVYVRIGKYILKDVDSVKEYKPMSCIGLEVNPNKHWDTDIFKAVMEVVKLYAYSGSIVQVDYAIDISCNIDDVVVLKTRKELGLYKGTRYFGARGQNGFVKIYNKGVESQLDYQLTRIETCYKLKDKFSSVDFGIIDRNLSNPDLKLSLSTGLIVDMLQELQMLGSSNVKNYLDKMNYKTRVQVLEALNNKVVEYRYDMEYLNKLLVDMDELFGVSTKKQIIEDEEGFLICDDSDLPWDI